MIRVVATGSECSGKTTLTAALAASYEVPWLGEYAREYVQEKGAPLDSGDVGEIARGQMTLEDEVVATDPELIIQDTDLLSTVLYSHHYYGHCPAWIERELERRRADLYLLAGIEIPWVADGYQRDRPNMRLEMQELFRCALIERGLRFAEVEGSIQQRMAAVRPLIDRLRGLDQAG